MCYVGVNADLFKASRGGSDADLISRNYLHAWSLSSRCAQPSTPSRDPVETAPLSRHGSQQLVGQR
eukprot:scaffold2957_cov226-Isochrysis_galbana.AAC.13